MSRNHGECHTLIRVITANTNNGDRYISEVLLHRVHFLPKVFKQECLKSHVPITLAGFKLFGIPYSKELFPENGIHQTSTPSSVYYKKDENTCY